MSRTFIHAGDYDRSAKGIESRSEWSESWGYATIPGYQVDLYRKLGVVVGDEDRSSGCRRVRKWFDGVLDAEDEGGLRSHGYLVERILAEYGVDGVRVAWELGGNLEIQVMMVKELPLQYQQRALEEVRQRFANWRERRKVRG